MQIVIDIPEEIKAVIDKNGTNEIVTETVWQAVKKGAPLPKGHGDLIDVDRKITVPIYDEQCEEWGEKTLTVLEALNRWSDDGVTVKDVVIPADKEVQE